jgi:hypothetical protein
MYRFANLRERDTNMKMLLPVIALVFLSTVVFAGDWGSFGDNSGVFVGKPFIGSPTNVSAGVKLGLTSFPDDWTGIGKIVAGHALSLDAFESTGASAAAGLSISVDKVPNPTLYGGIIVTGPDKWKFYLGTDLVAF